ncbi:MAG: Uncharacterised protein [Cellulomonadaceae bacterium TMED98]|nr:MAG: Uncharacterised protein [Cellulomonadaceae bacterium TMED98]
MGKATNKVPSAPQATTALEPILIAQAPKRGMVISCKRPPVVVAMSNS